MKETVLLSVYLREELHEITTFACTAASLSTEKYGGIESVPTEAAVLSMIGGQT